MAPTLSLFTTSNQRYSSLAPNQLTAIYYHQEGMQKRTSIAMLKTAHRETEKSKMGPANAMHELREGKVRVGYEEKSSKESSRLLQKEKDKTSAHQQNGLPPPSMTLQRTHRATNSIQMISPHATPSPLLSPTPRTLINRRRRTVRRRQCVPLRSLSIPLILHLAIQLPLHRIHDP